MPINLLCSNSDIERIIEYPPVLINIHERLAELTRMKLSDECVATLSVCILSFCCARPPGNILVRQIDFKLNHFELVVPKFVYDALTLDDLNGT